MQRNKDEREESRVEMEKLLKDKECLHCDKFFDCKGKPEGVKNCLNFTERKNDNGRR
jgi:hypothetical protein